MGIGIYGLVKQGVEGTEAETQKLKHLYENLHKNLPKLDLGSLWLEIVSC